MANLANSKWCVNPEKWLKPWHMGTHLKVLCESYPMNTNMIGFKWFSKILCHCALDESSLSIRRVKRYCLFFWAATGFNGLTLMLLVAILAFTKCSPKKLKNDWNPGIWVLIWEYLVRAIQWIPIWQGLNIFQKSLCPWALYEISLSIGRFKPAPTWLGLKDMSKIVCSFGLLQASLG